MNRMTADISFDEIAWLRANSPAWRLLRADSAPLVLGFLYRVFVADNIRSIAGTELASRLDDELYALNERTPGSFPKPAKNYLDDWASPESGWLRKYYLEGTDEPWFDATPAVEKALQWVRALGERDFVGTESRLNTIFDLLRQIVFGTETDPQAGIEELRRRRREIDDEIERIESGELSILDSSEVRDRYQQFSATARELLADFREVEENFRKLDRQLREKIAGWQGGKGELLDDVLGSRESIAGSDQDSTISCSPRCARKSCPTCWPGSTRSPTQPSAIPGCGRSTTTGWTRPNGPRRLSASYLSSSEDSWTTRCGSRTAG
jgi:Protein of unknown function (DUF3375)